MIPLSPLELLALEFAKAHRALQAALDAPTKRYTDQEWSEYRSEYKQAQENLKWHVNN